MVWVTCNAKTKSAALGFLMNGIRQLINGTGGLDNNGDVKMNKQVDYSPTYEQAVQNRFEVLVNHHDRLVELVTELIHESDSLLKDVLLSDPLDATIDLSASLMMALKLKITLKAMADVGDPWSEPEIESAP